MKAVERMRVLSSNRNRNVGRVWASESQTDHKDEIEAGRPGRPDGSIPLTVTSHWIFFLYRVPRSDLHFLNITQAAVGREDRRLGRVEARRLVKRPLWLSSGKT